LSFQRNAFQINAFQLGNISNAPAAPPQGTGWDRNQRVWDWPHKKQLSRLPKEVKQAIRQISKQSGSDKERELALKQKLSHIEAGIVNMYLGILALEHENYLDRELAKQFKIMQARDTIRQEDELFLLLYSML